MKALRIITIGIEDRNGLTTWHKVYNDIGNVTHEYDADNRLVREYAYNDAHMLSKTTFHNDDGPDTEEIRSYDPNGNLVTHTDQAGRQTTYTYDKENRQLTKTFAGETTKREYDAVGNMIALVSPEGVDGKFAGKKKEYVYDAHNRLIEVKEEALEDGTRLVTRYEYDKNDNLRHMYDPMGHHVEYLYDELNRKTRHIQHKSTGNLITQFGYDNLGNITSITDAKGQVFNYTYDLLNRRTDANYPDVPSPLLKLASIGFDYDANNNLTEVVETKYKPNNEQFIDTVSNVYDDFDRLDESTRRGLVIDYGYDHNGNRVSVSTVNGAVGYTYTLRNRIKTAVHGSDTTTYGYLPDGRLDTITYPNGTDVKYAYHPGNRVKSIEHKNGGGVFARYSYTYDKNGNRMSQEEVNSGVTETTSYQYDPMNRMKSFTVVGSTGGMQRKEYTYEGYNRKTERVFTNNVEVESKTFGYDETNWLTKVTGVAAGEAYTVDYSFDANGNTLSKVDSRAPDQPVSFVYNAENRLVQVTRGPAGSESVLGRFDYNHAGDRIRHRMSDRGDVDYYYDDGAVLEEHNAVDDSLLAFYQYAERLVALAQPSGKQYYHHDGLGSTVGLTDGVGAVKKTYQLDPWGNLRAESGVSDNRHIFTGQEHDPNTGLVYFGARYYDPEVGRFMTQDTYLGEQNTPPSLHRYLYAYSNPTVYVDPTGRSNECVGGTCTPGEGEQTTWDGWTELDVSENELGTGGGEDEVRHTVIDSYEHIKDENDRKLKMEEECVEKEDNGRKKKELDTNDNLKDISTDVLRKIGCVAALDISLKRHIKGVSPKAIQYIEIAEKITKELGDMSHESYLKLDGITSPDFRSIIDDLLKNVGEDQLTKSLKSSGMFKFASIYRKLNKAVEVAETLNMVLQTTEAQKWGKMGEIKRKEKIFNTVVEKMDPRYASDVFQAKEKIENWEKEVKPTILKRLGIGGIDCPSPHPRLEQGPLR